MNVSAERELGFAALRASFRTLMVLAERGLLSPQEVEQTYGSILGMIHDPKMHSVLTSQLDESYAALRQRAAETWREPGR